MQKDLPSEFRPIKRIIVLISLPGFTRSFQTTGDDRVAAFVHAYYGLCEHLLPKHGGDIVKFNGDACLALFDAGNAVGVVAAARDMESGVGELAKEHAVPVSIGLNAHLAVVIEGQFGTGGSRRRDIIGRGVNQAFLLGRGAGMRISEPVYRALPSGARASWIKHKPPTIYHRNTPDGAYEGTAKTSSA